MFSSHRKLSSGVLLSSVKRTASSLPSPFFLSTRAGVRNQSTAAAFSIQQPSSAAEVLGNGLESKLVQESNSSQTEPLTDSMLQDDFTYCFQQMSSVSRSFDFVTQQLPEELRKQVCVFYLLLRALDTIEDSVNIPMKRKVSLLKSFPQDPIGTVQQLSSEESENSVLLANIDRVVRAFESLDKKQRLVIQEVMEKMANGMSEHQNQQIHTTQEYEEYCWIAAGVVGEGLTKLFFQSGLQQKSFPQRSARDMGLFLQMVNIIRDFHEDRTEGRVFWPQELLNKYQSGDVSEFGSVSALNEMVEGALHVFPKSLGYLQCIEDDKIFNFCAIPQVMALATLSHVYNNPAVFQESIKIPRSETVKIVGSIQLRGMRAVNDLVKQYVDSLRAKVTGDSPTILKAISSIEEHMSAFASQSAQATESHDQSSTLTDHQKDPSKPQKVVVIGAGPGGLSSATLLAHHGYDVEVFEANSYVGGRNSAHQVGDSSFDLGPTMLMMRFVISQLFKDAGRDSTDYLDFVRVEPMYRLYFTETKKNMDFYSSKHPEKMEAEFNRVFPEELESYKSYMNFVGQIYENTMPMMQKVFNSHWDLICKEGIKALPHLNFPKSMWKTLKMFKSDLMKLSFTFQSVYLGMTPKTTPAFFNIIPYVEHQFGVWHIKGGLNKLNHALAKVLDEHGGKLHLSTPVKEVILDGKTVKGVELKDGRKIYADHVVLNADFSHAVNHLIPNAESLLKKWKPSKLKQYRYSSSTFMLYLDMDKVYEDVPVHNLVFAGDYEKNFHDIEEGKLPDHLSFYFRNSTVVDPEVNPKGGSGLYFLLPVPNELTNQGIDWDDANLRNKLREHLLSVCEQQAGMEDIRKHIRTEKIITPKDWESEHRVYGAATYNLAHNLLQLLSFRPRSKFEELDNLYISSGAGSPGSGIPVICENARMCCDTIVKQSQKQAKMGEWTPKDYIRVPLNSETFNDEEAEELMDEMNQSTGKRVATEQV